MRWLPIKTAPRDGSKFIAWIPETRAMVPCRYWNGRWVTFPSSVNNQPTLWILVPPPQDSPSPQEMYRDY